MGLIILAGNKDNHNSLDELSALERLEINVLCFEHSSTFFFWIVCILADNKDNYKILDGFLIRRDQTRVCGVTCP